MLKTATQITESLGWSYHYSAENVAWWSREISTQRVDRARQKRL